MLLATSLGGWILGLIIILVLILAVIGKVREEWIKTRNQEMLNEELKARRRTRR